MSNVDTLPKILWLWIPVTVAILQAFLEVMLPEHILAPLHSEQGPHEALQFIIISVAFLIALSAFMKADLKAAPWFGAWIFLASACCLYVAGEEISWGQKFLDWSTPEFWSGINDQNETNLHNTSSWFDQKPRLLLLVGVMVGGLVFPLFRRIRSRLLPKRFERIYPPSCLSVTAILLLAVFLLDRADDLSSQFKFFTRGSEVEELYMFWFVLLYLIVMRRRIQVR